MADTITSESTQDVSVLNTQNSNDVIQPVVRDVTENVSNDVEMQSVDDAEDRIRPRPTIPCTCDNCEDRIRSRPNIPCTCDSCRKLDLKIKNV